MSKKVKLESQKVTTILCRHLQILLFILIKLHNVFSSLPTALVSYKCFILPFPYKGHSVSVILLLYFLVRGMSDTVNRKWPVFVGQVVCVCDTTARLKWTTKKFAFLVVSSLTLCPFVCLLFIFSASSSQKQADIILSNFSSFLLELLCARCRSSWSTWTESDRQAGTWTAQARAERALISMQHATLLIIFLTVF